MRVLRANHSEGLNFMKNLIVILEGVSKLFVLCRAILDQILYKNPLKMMTSADSDA